MFDYCIFIGRFNPLHNGHVHVMKEALKISKNLIILIGSADCARSPKNPFTYHERREMLENVLYDDLDLNKRILDGTTVFAKPISDFPTNNDRWVASVQERVEKVIATHRDTNILTAPRICIIGLEKDKSSDYLKWFPQWNLVRVPMQYSTINATEIRNAYLQKLWQLPSNHHAPKAVAEFMKKFAHTPEFKWLVDAAEYDRTYKPEEFDNHIVSCVDAVVLQSGHVLIGQRVNHPGKGLWALPGGHVKKHQTFLEAILAELAEETHISDQRGEIPPGKLASFIKRKELFDDPGRSLRARVITMGYLFRLPDGPRYTVRGDDDMEHARWADLAFVKKNKQFFHEDHYSIIEEMVGI